MNLKPIIDKYNIILLVTFGSFGTPRFNSNSDIDIAFKSKEELSNDEKLNLIKGFIDYFKRDNIDLVDIRRASPLLLYEIACNGKVLYEDNNSFLHFKLHASFRYSDTKHLRKARKAYLDNRIKDLEKDVDYTIGGF